MEKTSKIQLINKYLPVVVDPLPETIPDTDLYEAIRARVKYLLDTDMERLLHLLYRVDVNENNVRHILSLSPPETIDQELTRAILDRLQEKIRLREKYRGI